MLAWLILKLLQFPPILWLLDFLGKSEKFDKFLESLNKKEYGHKFLVKAEKWIEKFGYWLDKNEFWMDNKIDWFVYNVVGFNKKRKANITCKYLAKHFGVEKNRCWVRARFMDKLNLAITDWPKVIVITKIEHRNRIIIRYKNADASSTGSMPLIDLFRTYNLGTEVESLLYAGI